MIGLRDSNHGIDINRELYERGAKGPLGTGQGIKTLSLSLAWVTSAPDPRVPAQLLQAPVRSSVRGLAVLHGRQCIERGWRRFND